MGAELCAAAAAAGAGLAGGLVLVDPVGAHLGLHGGGGQGAEQHDHRHGPGKQLILHDSTPPSGRFGLAADLVVLQNDVEIFHAADRIDRLGDALVGGLLAGGFV